jgi:hypothetical protein
MNGMSPNGSGPFPPTSRYFKVATATYVDPQGNEHTYLTRRFLPPSSRFALLQEYSVQAGDRLDNLAAQFLGLADQFWKLCDANDAMIPEDLVGTIGSKLRITLPEGVPAPVTDAQ